MYHLSPAGKLIIRLAFISKLMFCHMAFGFVGEHSCANTTYYFIFGSLMWHRSLDFCFMLEKSHQSQTPLRQTPSLGYIYIIISSEIL